MSHGGTKLMGLLFGSVINESLLNTGNIFQEDEILIFALFPFLKWKFQVLHSKSTDHGSSRPHAVCGRDPKFEIGQRLVASAPHFKPIPISAAAPSTTAVSDPPSPPPNPAAVVLLRLRCTRDAVGRRRRRARRRQRRSLTRAVRAPGGPRLLEGEQCAGRVSSPSPQDASPPSLPPRFLLH